MLLFNMKRNGSEKSTALSMSRDTSTMSSKSEGLDEDDPAITGIAPMRRKRLSQLLLRRRRSDSNQAKTQLRPTLGTQDQIEDDRPLRQDFLLTFSNALLKVGAPGHRIIAQLTAAAKVLDVMAEFIYLPGIIMVNFQKEDGDTGRLHFLKSDNGLNLGKVRSR